MVEEVDYELMEQCFRFLFDREWIHNFQVTSVFQDGIFQHIPSSWQLCLKKLSTPSLNEIPFLGANCKVMYPDWPPDLHNFLSKAAELAFPRCVDLSQMGIGPTKLNPDMASGMNSKKNHEVSYMASIVHHMALKAKCELIIDVGSGLGYLDHVLHQVYGHRVLGLETAQGHASAAEVRALKQGIDCGGVKSIQFNIQNTAECFSALESLLQETHLTLRCRHEKQRESEVHGHIADNGAKGEAPRACLIGLHCCGDLSTSMLSLFHGLACIKALCCVCCCYHKMAFSHDRFHNFPLSGRGKAAFEKLDLSHVGPFISPYTFRLGAQETRCRWRQQTDADHQSHRNHVAFRGLISLTDEDTTSVRQKVRKCDFTDFETFLESFYNDTPLPEPELSRRKQALKDWHEKFKGDFDLIEVITVLQVVLQPVIETLVYQDRIQWLQEIEYTSARVIPIFDELISPRNLAIVALKAS